MKQDPRQLKFKDRIVRKFSFYFRSDMAGRNFKGLIVWQKSMDLAVEIHELVKFLPKDELYGISNQLR